MKTNTLMQVQEIKISYSLNGNSKSKSQLKQSELIQIQRSEDCEKIFRENWEDIEYRESMYLMILNKANKCIGINRLSVGGSSGTLCDPKFVFQVALKANACAIIIAHNHPSGNSNPSDVDKILTRRIKEIGTLMELPLLDHVIISPEYGKYISLADEGII